jgi:hypothetical protein
VVPLVNPRGSDGRFGLRWFLAKLTPTHVWHSPRSLTPATLLGLPSAPFTVPPYFLPATTQVKKKQAGDGGNGKNMKLETLRCSRTESISTLGLQS